VVLSLAQTTTWPEKGANAGRGDEFGQSTTPEYAEASWDHLFRSHCLTIEKAVSVLGFTPQYEPEQAVLESVRWLIDHDQLPVATPLHV
jgi:nucleoside-diphosphate-sugar epimerase